MVEHSKKLQRKLDNDRKAVRASHVQTKLVRQLNYLNAKMESVRDKQEFLRKCGLDREAKRLNDEYNALVRDRVELLDRITAERRECARHLLACFVGCDLLTELAEEFSKGLKSFGYTPSSSDDAFTEVLMQHAKDLNETVCIIDQAGNYDMSNFYSDMAEDITSELKSLLTEKLTQFMNTPTGEKYF